jgi:molecular chaperone Hsp33
MTFLSQDRIVRSTSDTAKFRLVVVDATRAAHSIAGNHEARGYAAQLLGEAISSALLLASGLKGPGTIQLRFSLSGDISRVNADATPFGLVRAMIPREEILRTGSFEPMVLPQTLRVVKLDKDGSRLSEGLVEMVAADISASVTHYLSQSEQGTYLLRVAARYDEAESRLRYAGGLLIEAFPGFDAATWKQVEAIAQGIDLEAHVRPDGQGLRVTEIYDLFAEFNTQVHKEFEIEPFCPCSESGVLRALSSLGRDGLESLYLEGREAEMFCEFCRKRYLVSQDQIKELMDDAEFTVPEEEPYEPESPDEPAGPKDP